MRIECQLEARSDLVVCGLEVGRAAFLHLDPGAKIETERRDGSRVPAGSVVATIVDAVEGTGVEIVDTRKTLPGWRVLDKYAVRTGGGGNHRTGLYDALLIKDNHIAAAGGVGAAIRAARESAATHLWLQVEVENMADADEAVAAGVDSLLLDNRGVSELQEFAQKFRDRCVLEASGGIQLESVAAVARTGVHRISVGALTHSVTAADLALEVRNLGGVTP